MSDRPQRTAWQRAEAVFAAALEADPCERDAIVDAQCAGNAELKREVASLLEAHALTGAVDRLAHEVLAPALGQVHTQAGIEPGRTVGHYVVLDTLGAGGMGVVCRARNGSMPSPLSRPGPVVLRCRPA